MGISLLALMTILPNLNRLLGSLLGKGAVVTDAVATFNQANIEAFLSNALPPLNLELTNLMLFGFWGERYHFALPGDLNPLRWCFAIVLLLGAIGGFVLHFSAHRSKVLYLSLLALIAWVL